MRKVRHALHRLAHRYFARCRFCGYAGYDWPDSGECPSCGEVN
jgi:rubrerythrin